MPVVCPLLRPFDSMTLTLTLTLTLTHDQDDADWWRRRLRDDTLTAAPPDLGVESMEVVDFGKREASMLFTLI